MQRCQKDGTIFSPISESGPYRHAAPSDSLL